MPVPVAGAQPAIDPELQKGTTPLVKPGPDGTPTRNFQNYVYPAVREADLRGPRAIVDTRFKLVIDGSRGKGTELFDLESDPGEKRDLVATHPAEAQRLETLLVAWQRSVLASLTGADYR